jgi:hypothetical protein
MPDSELVRKSFTLDPKRDRDILNLLEQQDSRGQSRLVRRALRLLLRQDENTGLTRQEVVDACRQAIRQELAGRLVAQDSAASAVTNESSEAARNLAAFEEELDTW